MRKIFEELDVDMTDHLEKERRSIKELYRYLDVNYLKRVFKKHPDRIEDILNVVGMLLLVAAHPEMFNHEAKNSNASSNISFLGFAGWDNMAHEFLDGATELNKESVVLISKLMH